MPIIGISILQMVLLPWPRVYRLLCCPGIELYLSWSELLVSDKNIRAFLLRRDYILILKPPHFS
jgi:hypothetical protein